MAKDRKINFIIGAKNATNKVFGSVRNALNSLGGKLKAIFSPGGLIAGGVALLGGGVLAKSFIDAARTTENYQVRLKVLLGSAEKGKALFADMAKYAAQVPFELEEIMGSATQLAGILKGGNKEINQWMPLIGDLAAATGLGISEATEQVSRMLSAGAASADLFRERGVLSMLGFTAGVSYSAEETKKKLMSAWTESGSRFKGATKLMASTWDGMISMFADKWYQFRMLVNDSGAFASLKATLQSALESLDAFFASGRAKQFAEAISKAFVEMLPKVIEFARVAFVAFAQVLPKAILLLIDLVGKVGLAFSGWALIWNGLKQGWLALEILVMEGAKKIAEAMMFIMKVQNIGGVFDGPIKQYQDAIAKMDGTIVSLDVGLSQTVDQQKELLTQTDAHERKMAKYKETVNGMSGAFDNFADSMSSAFKNAADASIKEIERVEKKASSVNWDGVGVGKSGADSIEGFSRSVSDATRRGE